MNTIWYLITLFTLVIILIFSLDDLMMDLVAFFSSLKPEKLLPEALGQMHGQTQKRIAILIANWREDDIIERMIHGNRGRIDYQNYDIFLGVYPNDTLTVAAATRLQSAYTNVFVVKNSRLGPTSKGQMLNEIASFIRAQEIKSGHFFEIFLLQDSEDIIHPLALKLINVRMDDCDFLQTPVFSLPSSSQDFTRGTYIDEFAESHTRDMLVRSHLDGGIPSAGVGTALSRLFVMEMMARQGNQLMKEDTLTEDYHLGLMARRLEYRSEFICCYRETSGGKDYIATREYFPASVKTSVRQKTRWTLGICLQGYQNLKWSKRGIENYFLWRDRRAILNAPLLVLCYLMTLSYVGYFLVQGDWPDFLSHSGFVKSLIALNLGLMLHKILQRIRLVMAIYERSTAIGVPLRWILANGINTTAAMRALYQQWQALRTGQRPQWVKTSHELPQTFGIEPLIDLQGPEKVIKEITPVEVVDSMNQEPIIEQVILKEARMKETMMKETMMKESVV